MTLGTILLGWQPSSDEVKAVYETLGGLGHVSFTHEGIRLTLPSGDSREVSASNGVGAALSDLKSWISDAGSR